ncbi:MAG: hypothetical protein ACR2QC_00940 [Gammaproteobacteria bacterium]
MGIIRQLPALQEKDWTSQSEIARTDCSVVRGPDGNYFQIETYGTRGVAVSQNMRFTPQAVQQLKAFLNREEFS